jgi:hypothetical protein
MSLSPVARAKWMTGRGYRLLLVDFLGSSALQLWHGRSVPETGRRLHQIVLRIWAKSDMHTQVDRSSLTSFGSFLPGIEPDGARP